MNRPTREELERKYFELEPVSTFRNAAVDLAIWAMEQVEKPETKAVGFDEWFEKNWQYDLDRGPAEEEWNAAQAALIASGAVIPVPPGSEWPEDAVEMRVMFEELHTEQPYLYYKIIPRPVEAWRPREGDKVWRKSSLRDCNVLVLYDPEIDDPSIGEFVAAYYSADEITWTRDQLRQRGRFWESGK